MITKREAEKLIKLKGETRGVNLKIDLQFVLDRKGEEGLKKVEEKLAKLGFPLKYKDIRPMDFYPLGLSVINLMVVKEFFGFNEKEVEEWGASLVKFSIIEKVFMKYFGSLKLIASQIPKMWQRHYTVGDLQMPEFSEEKRYSVLRLKGFKIHPLYCGILKGYFAKITELIVKAPAVTKETKCEFKGDEYHEFTTRW